MILPIVKQHTEKKEICSIPKEITYCYNGEQGKLGAEAFASFMPLAEEDNGNAFVEFCIDTSLDAHDEIYSVSILPNKITVAFRDARGELVWCNSIVYNYRSVLAGGHSDDRAAEGDCEGSWGWIADRGFDLIQTDWTLAASLFLQKTNRLYK